MFSFASLFLRFHKYILYLSKYVYTFFIYIWKHIKFFNKCQSAKSVCSFYGLKEIQQICKTTK